MIIVRLGEIIFNASEVPEEISGGGVQMTAVQQLIGGVRVVDTLGKADDDISFRGLFRGIAALERVKYLDGLRVSGNQVTFTYSSYHYNVVVKDFKWHMRMAYQVYYEITLLVVQDLNQPVTIAIPISFSDEVLGAYAAASDLALFINNPGVISSLGEVGLALQAVDVLEDATLSELGTITAAITAAAASVTNAISGIGQ